MLVFQTIESPARRPGQSSEKIVSLVDPEKVGTHAALMFIKHVPKIVNGPFSSGRSATICCGKNKPKHPCKNNTTSLCMEASRNKFFGLERELPMAELMDMGLAR
jgi:hypothetical protein